MENIKLDGITLEPHYGRNTDKAPALLARWKERKGHIPSEADIRLMGLRNFKNTSEIAKNYWDTSTLSATKGDVIKVILPYDNSGSYQLTNAAEFGLGLINPSESLVDNGVNLDVDGRWEKLEGSGVYTLKRKGLVLNQDLTEKQAMEHELLLTKLGHPDYVDPKFARSEDEVAEMIGKTFELGKSECKSDTMMGQYLPNVSKKGILKTWYACRLNNGGGSGAGAELGDDLGQFAFVSVGDANSNAAGVVDADQARIQLKTLEGILKSEQINQIEVALNERDKLKYRLLTTDQIYFALQAYFLKKDEPDVRKILGKLTGQ